MKVRPPQNMEEKEIERIFDMKFQEVMARGKAEGKMMTATEMRKAIKGMKNKKSSR